MKKAMKKLMAALLAVAMLCAMAVPAFAAEVTNSSVDITNHRFEAYQIFAGDLDSGKLSNVIWGSGVKESELLAALRTSTGFGDFSTVTSAADVAKVLSATGYTDEQATAFAAFIVNNNYLTDVKTTGTGSVTLPAAGYYLIKDVTDVEGKDDAKNLTLLKVSGPENVTPKVKTDKPTVEKKVKDTNDSTGSTSGWQDSADYDIGDTIPYQLTATLGDMSNFKTYYVQFVDTMTHLTYKNITSVKVGDVTLTGEQYNFNWDSSTKTLTVSIDNVLAFNATKGTTIVVEYEATLDDDAMIGSTGNPNEVYLKYSNNPNGSGYGETPKDKNIVFTYKVTANKVDQDNRPLTGAAFALYKKVDGATADADDITVEGSVYKLVGKLNVGADGNVADPTKTSFEWEGIDDGDYLIKEIITPAGYNTIDDMTFTVFATHNELADDPKLLTLTGNAFTGDVTTGTLSANIINRMGATLPSTGGIGTTIFYVIGGGLMIAAAVLLITKKRMEGKN